MITVALAIYIVMLFGLKLIGLKNRNCAPRNITHKAHYQLNSIQERLKVALSGDIKIKNATEGVQNELKLTYSNFIWKTL